MATLGSRGPRNILEDTRASGDTAATVAIASISDQDWYISRTHGVYHIPACAKGEPYALLLITSRGDALDLGDNRRFPFTISAREIAEDLLQDLHDHGVFVCAGARPSAGGTGGGGHAARKLLSSPGLGWRHDVGARPFLPRNFRPAPPRRDRPGNRTRMGLRPDAYGGMPGVRRTRESGCRGVQTLRRNPGRGKSREARIRLGRGRASQRSAERRKRRARAQESDVIWNADQKK